jgi:hypothetical protein
MADSAFKTAPYASYTSVELQKIVDHGFVTDEVKSVMISEIARRIARDAGDVSVMFPAERLRFVRANG